MNGKGDKRRPELIKGSYRKNYDSVFVKKIFSDKQERLFEMAKKYDVDLSPIYNKKEI
jgi:hypothetical protein